jgi:hypothetical protein
MPARPKYPGNLRKGNDGLGFNRGLDNCKLSGVPSGNAIAAQRGVTRRDYEKKLAIIVND